MVPPVSHVSKDSSLSNTYGVVMLINLVLLFDPAVYSSTLLIKVLLKGGRHAKKVFLIHTSNGYLNGKIMKYTFFNFFIPRFNHKTSGCRIMGHAAHAITPDVTSGTYKH